jgi:glycosyltransferase involved in cell wall biosynthesis
MRFFVSTGGSGERAGFGAGGPDASRGLLARQFLPVLARLGQVDVVASPAEGVRRARQCAAPALHLCLALPHELPPDAAGETVPVFGLGLAHCPDTAFGGDPATDWRARLGASGGAICFSTHAAAAVRALMGAAYPVLAAPPPLGLATTPTPPSAATLVVQGAVLDTARWAETGPPDRAGPQDGLAGEAVEPDALAPMPQQKAPEWPKSARYRFGIARLHAVHVYREVVRDLLPRPVASLVSRAGRAGVRVRDRMLSRRVAAAASHPALAFAAPPPAAMPSVQDDGAWQIGSCAVALDGMVFAAVQGAWDRSWGDALSAFVATCRDEDGITLVVKTAELGPETRAGLAGYLRRLGPFACRVVILEGEIEGGLDDLIGVASLYLCASSAEASPLPMMRFMAAGRPAISPAHSALADFVSDETSLVVASGLEYEPWPGDVEERLGATGWRLDWESLCAGILAARALAADPHAYAARARLVSRRMQALCGQDAVLATLSRLTSGDFGHPERASAGRLTILVHSETDAGTLANRLGLAEYSYFFVLRFFTPVLERIGRVVRVTDPAREVDVLHAQARARGESCVFLSFAPPHRTQTRLACPTLPVFAWEFDTIPHEHWGGERRHDWVAVLRRLGWAIVHSQATVDTVRAALGADFPVWSIPAPVWDGFAPSPGQEARPAQATISVRGTVIDTAAMDMAGLRHDENWMERVHAERALRGPLVEVRLGGTIYSSVFNPEDGRKNWTDMIAAFCRVFRRQAGATLVLKLTHHDGMWGMALMLKHLRRLMPFACRVVLIHGYLPDADYARLVAVSTFTVNTSHGEGQCLPLMEAMSAGKPAVAPPHTGMADYLGEDCAFLVRSTAEPSAWPQDGRWAIRTHRRRIDLATLEAAYRDSFAVAADRPAAYAAMSLAATERLRRHCSGELTERRLRAVFDFVETATGMRQAEDVLS